GRIALAKRTTGVRTAVDRSQRVETDGWRRAGQASATGDPTAAASQGERRRRIIHVGAGGGDSRDQQIRSVGGSRYEEASIRASPADRSLSSGGPRSGAGPALRLRVAQGRKSPRGHSGAERAGAKGG